jgi:hypothetical protein
VDAGTDRKESEVGAAVDGTLSSDSASDQEVGDASISDVDGDRPRLDVTPDGPADTTASDTGSNEPRDASQPDVDVDANVSADGGVGDTVSSTDAGSDVADAPDALETGMPDGVINDTNISIDIGVPPDAMADGTSSDSSGGQDVYSDGAQIDGSDASTYRILENPRSNANTNLWSIDNNHFWSNNDIEGQSFVAQTGSLVAGQMLLYLHGTDPSPEIQFAILGADANGDIDVSQQIFVSATFKIPAGVNSFETAAYFPLGNLTPIALSPGQTYFFAASVRSNTVNPAGSVDFPGSGGDSTDRIAGHINQVTTTGAVSRQKDSLDLIFSLTFRD